MITPVATAPVAIPVSAPETTVPRAVPSCVESAPTPAEAPARTVPGRITPPRVIEPWVIPAVIPRVVPAIPAAPAVTHVHIHVHVYTAVRVIRIIVVAVIAVAQIQVHLIRAGNGDLTRRMIADDTLRVLHIRAASRRLFRHRLFTILRLFGISPDGAVRRRVVGLFPAYRRISPVVFVHVTILIYRRRLSIRCRREHNRRRRLLHRLFLSYCRLLFCLFLLLVFA